MSSNGKEDANELTNAGYGKCANPECNETGKLKCAACASVVYCSAQCQKKHWNAHKVNCKSAKVANVPQKVDPNLILQSMKNEIQRFFAMGDFENAIKKSEEALSLVKTFPPIVAISETIQININLSTAYVHLNRPMEAQHHADIAVQNAETAVTQRPNQPQPLEVLSIALSGKAVALLSNGKVDEALEAAQKSVTIAESVFPKNDPRLHKSLRTLALIYDKKGNHNDAEVNLLRAYTIVCLAGGPQCGEAQLLTEDLVGLYNRKSDFDGAEKYARKNYKALKEKTLNGPENAVVADSATRLANTLVRKGDIAAAEPLIAEALEIRDSKEYAAMNPLGIAFSLSQYAGVLEQLGKLDSNVESMLMRSLEIFTRIKGPGSPEAMNVLAQLKNVRGKRNATPNKVTSSSGVTVDDASDDENSNQNTKTPSSSSGKHSALSSPKKSQESYDINAEDQRKIDSLPPNNGVVRMQLAGHFFEQSRFAAAEVVLQQAFNIFLQANGPEHEHTRAARQNLNLVRNNRLNQLWMQVVAEEVLNKLEELKISGKQIIVLS